MNNYVYHLIINEPRHEKTSLQCFNQIRYKPACAAKNMARSLKIQIEEEDELYYLSSENKGAD